MATHSSIPRESPLVGYSPWGHKESDMTEPLSLSGTSLDHAELLCGRSFITVKKDKESF